MARELTELERLESPMDPPFLREVITTMRVALARIEGKLDSVTNLSHTVQTLGKGLYEAETRLTKLEAWQGFAVWIAGGVWALTLVIIAAALAFYWHH